MELEFGVILGKPGERPTVDASTSTFKLDSYGKPPLIGARVRRVDPSAYRLSFVVQKWNAATKSFETTETSQTWSIPANEDGQSYAFVGPDFPGGAHEGRYKLEVFVDGDFAKSVEFRLAANAP